MAKKLEDPLVAELKKFTAAKRVIIGTDRTRKQLKQGLLSKVYVSMNCPIPLRESVQKSCGIAQVEFVLLPHASTELGMACKKPFPISILGITK